MKKNYKIVVFIIIVFIFIFLLIFLPIRQWLQSLLEWSHGLGWLGAVIVIMIYIISCIAFLPGSILTLGAGFIFGVIRGTIVVSIGSTLGACAAFLIGRTIGRDWVAEKISRNEKFAAIDNAVGRQGFKIVLLTRLSPVFPFNLLNYAYGLTKVPFYKYALASWIGMIPGTIMYVYFGAGLQNLASAATGRVETAIAGRIFFWLGMAAAVAVTIFVTHIARKSLNQIH
ncbi:MAG TPA: hypothetical protein DDX75_12650 [Phycisphaerales bacterium]|nr:hypothetical protein [Phycisphaerales bacterium]